MSTNWTNILNYKYKFKFYNFLYIFFWEYEYIGVDKKGIVQIYMVLKKEQVQKPKYFGSQKRVNTTTNIETGISK